MKKTFWVDTFRNIRKRIVSWLSISIIIFIGISGILGIHSAAYSMEKIATEFYVASNFKDYEIASNLGIKEAEIEKIKSLDYITDAEGVQRFSGQISFADDTADVTIFSLTDRISLPKLIDGRLPAKEDEVAIDADMAREMGIKIGDVVWLRISSNRLEDAIKLEFFEVTGIAFSSEFLKRHRSYYCLLADEAFDTSGLSFDYTNIFLKGDVDPGQSAVSNRYLDQLRDHTGDLNAVTEELAAERESSFAKELDDEYAKKEKEARDKLKEAKAQLDDAHREFDEKVAEGEGKIEEGKKALEEGKKRAETELKNALKKIQDGEAEYNQKVADGEKQLADGRAQLEKELNDKKWQLFDGFLQLDNAEKLLNEKEAEYRAGYEKMLEYQEKYNSARGELDLGWSAFNKKISELEEYLGDEAIMIDDIAYHLEEIGETKLAEEVLDMKKLSIYGRAVKLLDLYNKYEVVQEVVDIVIPNVGDYIKGIERLKDAKATLEDGELQYAEKGKQLKDGKEFLEESRQKLDDAWFSLGQAKQKLADGQNELSKKEPEARAQLAEKEAEFERMKADGAKQLEDAKAAYNTNKDKVAKEIKAKEKELEDAIAEFEIQKKEGEEKLADAEKQYADSEAEVEKALADAKKEIENAKKIGNKWIVQTRETNTHFMSFKTVYEVLANFFLYFAPLYVIIVTLVVFFTMTIIVEEQKSEVGVLKAFGMYVSEIMQKYLTFGVTAALLGVGMGLAGAYGMQYLFLYSLREDYVFGAFPMGLNPLAAVILAIGSVALTAFVVWRACTKLLNCSAVGLINGTEPVKKSIMKAKTKDSSISLYSALIFNNIYTDLGRVTVSMVIIMLSCLMIGLGFTTRNGLYQALEKQLEEVWHYDLFVEKENDITKEQEEAVLDYIKDFERIEIYTTGVLAEHGNAQTPFRILVVDSYDELGTMYTLRGPKGEVRLTDDGMYITAEMMDKDNFKVGDELRLITSDLSILNVKVAGYFTQYFEKTAIMTKTYYEQIFGERPEDNSYFLIVGDVDKNKAALDLRDMDGVNNVTVAESFSGNYDTVLLLFDAIVVVIIGLAILLAFMIQLNLSNILVLHRMRELLTMRVNGFSHGQVIGYLARETIVTAVVGLVLGVVVGIPFSRFIITKLEPAAVMFYRKPYSLAWIIAVAICAFFSLLINAIAFRKVGKVPLTDITKY